MRKSSILLCFALIGVIVILSGCISSQSTTAGIPTPTPQIVYVTVLVTPTTQTPTVLSTATSTQSVPIQPTPTVQHRYNVFVTAYQITSNNDIVLTYVGGQDASYLTSLHWTITSSDGRSTSGFDNVPTIGKNYKINGYGTNGQDHVICSGSFMGGADQAILDTYV